MNMRTFWLAAAVALVAFASTAQAKTVCTVTASSVAFGAYNPISGAGIDITGTVTLTCDKDRTDYTITLSTGSSGSYANRVMSFGGNQLPYQLFLDSARTIIWGDGAAGGTGLIAGTLPKGQTSISFTVYGRVYGGANVVPGFYTDSILTTADYQ